MTRSQLKEQADASLEIISIGSLYNGSWDKKYWSSSRGKDRYPYPVGYQAVQAYNGIKYKLEVHEGPKGPLFMILSMDGRGSFSGQTPDIAWEMFQRKGCVQTKKGLGKRSACKVDGVEFFGFKNPFIQRLLRELVANVSGTAELDTLPSNLSNKASGSAQTGVAHHSENTELVSCREKPMIARKRSRSHGNDMTVHPNGANIKKVRNQGSRIESTTAKLSNSVSIDEANQGFCEKGSCVQEKDAVSESTQDAHTVLQDGLSTDRLKDISRKIETDVNAAVASFQQDYCPDTESTQDAHNVLYDGISTDILEGISREMETDANAAVASFQQDYCPDTESTQDAHNVVHDGLSANRLEGISREMEIDVNSAVASFQQDYCPDTEDNNHDASDTSCLKQVSLGNENIKQLDNIIPEESVMDSHPEAICSFNANSGSKRDGFDSVGQDMVKSMMTYLLPQAIPLLKENSDRKMTATSNLETSTCDVNSKDVLSMDEEDGENKEWMDIQHENYKSAVPSLEHLKPGFDNLEGEQHCDHVNINRSISSTADNDQAKEDIKPNDSCGFQFCDRMNDELLVNHHEVTGSKKSYDRENGENLPGICQMGNLYATECPPSCTSSGRVVSDETSHNNKSIGECLLNLQANSCKVDQKTPQDSKESNGNEQPCSSGSLSQLSHAQNANDSSVKSASKFSEALNKQVIVGKEALGIDTLPSSQVPSVAYSRRKAQSMSHLDKQVTAGKEAAGIDTLLSSQVPCVAYSRRKTRNLSHLAKEYSHPSSEASNISVGKHYGAETSSTKSTHSFDIKLGPLPGNQRREDLLSEPTLREPSSIDCSYEITMKAAAGLEKTCHHSSTLELEEASPLGANRSHDSGLHDKPVLKAQDMGATFKGDSKDSYPHCDVELYREAEGMSKIVGSYLHHLPVLSIFLCNIDNVIHICVVCGHPVEKNRTLVTYTVEMKEPRLGYPSLVGHTTVMVPTLRDYLGKEIAVERTGFQLTPDGNYLVLVGGIITPFCRTGSINCPCSTCTSGKFDDNLVKIVQVKYGYVSIMANLRSSDCVHCVLVCEPDKLVAVGRSGRLHLWVMDSTWRKQIESHTIPSEDNVSPNLVELKKIPEFSNLVVGHNGYGEFSLWDIQKRALLSRFFAPSASANQFIPISLFSWKGMKIFSSNLNSKDHIKELLCATNTSSKNAAEEHSSLQIKDIAIWLFASTTSDSCDSLDYLPANCQEDHAELWKLMLLANSTVTFGAELDLRTSAIGASAGRGIIGTQDGLVYVWELSTGNKLGTLLRFKGASVYCIATDDRDGGVVAVAADSRLLLYLLSSGNYFDQVHAELL